MTERFADPTHLRRSGGAQQTPSASGIEHLAFEPREPDGVVELTVTLGT